MFFDHYPYTNFHNVNLDWVLQAVKAWGRTVEANDQAFKDLKEANEDFKRYVRNYLQDLDVSDEINAKLDRMLASGVLTPYFAPYVQGYVNSWLNAHVTPTSPALDSSLTLSGAAARADSTGHRLKDLAYIDALSTPEIIAALNRSQVLPGYRVQGITYDYNGHYYVCGGSVDETGTGVIVKMTKPDFTDAEITEIPQLGHANDITYYDGYLYVCTVGGGNAPQWGIYKINVNDFTDKTLISNAPENTIGISYRQGDFWILAPYRIYRTTDFTSYEVVVANTNDLLTAYGIPTEGRISQTIFRAAGYLIGWVCSFVFEDRHYGALTFFNSTGEPIAFKMFPAYHTEIQGAVYADMSIYLLADGNMVNVFRMDPRHLSYVQLKAGDDLNSFTGRETLYSTGSNVSAELLNSPSAGEGFTVQVDRLGVYNTIQTARTNSGREMYRIKSFNSDTWGEWIEPAAEVAQIKEDLSHTTGNNILTGWVKGKLINTSISAVDINSPSNSTNYHYLITDCTDGDIFTISGIGGGSGRLWCFVDSNNTNIAVAASNITETNLVLVAPTDATKLIVNSNDYTLSNTFVIRGYHASLPQKTAIQAMDALGVKDFAFTVGLITTAAVGATVNFNGVFNAQYCHAIIECKAGEKFTITGTTDGTSGKRVYLFTDTGHKCLYRHDTDASLTNYVVYAPADGFLVVNSYLKDPHKVTSGSIIDWIRKAPLTYLTPNIRGALSNKIIGTLSKGYIVMMTDDGNTGLATDTIPFAISKNVPFTFAVMSSSEVFADASYTSTIMDAVNNHGCEISQHGSSRWDDKSEVWLNNFFDNEKTFWDSLGVSVKSAAIPGHYTTELIKAVCGGRFGVVRSGYRGVDFTTGNPSGEVTNYYDYYTSGARSDLYCLSSFNCSVAGEANNLIPAVDYAYSNNKILICYFHENAMDSEAWQRVSDFVDYAKNKGLTFTTLGKIPYLL